MSVGRSSEEAEASPDPSWRGLYKAGGVSGVLIGILVIISSVLLFTTPQAPSSGGAATLQYIASNRSVYIVEQVLGLTLYFLEIVALLALYMAIKNLTRAMLQLVQYSQLSLRLSFWHI